MQNIVFEYIYKFVLRDFALKFNTDILDFIRFMPCQIFFPP